MLFKCIVIRLNNLKIVSLLTYYQLYKKKPRMQLCVSIIIQHIKIQAFMILITCFCPIYWLTFDNTNSYLNRHDDLNPRRYVKLLKPGFSA